MWRKRCYPSRGLALILGSRSSSYKVPERRTPNEQRKAAWIADLANPDVPLSKLAAAVPGGPKGHDYFDLLEQNRVPIPRAVWYARILGYADMVRVSTLCFPST